MCYLDHFFNIDWLITIWNLFKDIAHSRFFIAFPLNALR